MFLPMPVHRLPPHTPPARRHRHIRLRALPSHPLLPLLAAIALLAGCGTTVEFESLRAPELDLGRVRTIRLGDLKTGALPSPPVHGPGGLVASTAAESAERRRDPAQHDWAMRDLAEAIRRNGTFLLTTDDAYDAWIDALYKYRAADDVRNATLGSGEAGVEVTRTASTTIEFSLRDAQGIRLGAAVARGEAAKAATGRTTNDAAFHLATGHRDLFLTSIAAAHGDLVAKIAPHKSLESRLLEKGDDPAIHRANKRAARKAWDEAVPVWRQALAGSPRDRAAALHNLAVYDEMRGELDSAWTKHEEVRRLAPSEEHDEDWLRIEQRLRERKRLEGRREQAPAE